MSRTGIRLCERGAHSLPVANQQSWRTTNNTSMKNIIPHPPNENVVGMLHVRQSGAPGCIPYDPHKNKLYDSLYLTYCCALHGESEHACGQKSSGFGAPFGACGDHELGEPLRVSNGRKVDEPLDRDRRGGNGLVRRSEYPRNH